MELFLPGPVIPKGRPRTRTYIQNGQVKTIAYTPTRTRHYADAIVAHAKAIYADAHEKPIPMPTPVWMEIYIHQHFPKSLPSKRPDIINLASNLLDALNTIAYDDDSQVVVLIIRKQESATPMLRIVVKPA